MELPDADRSVRQFSDAHNCDAIVLMGMHIDADGRVRRDLAVIAIDQPTLAERITAALLAAETPALGLRPYRCAATTTLPTCQCFEQTNVRASRKQILPIVQAVLDESM